MAFTPTPVRRTPVYREVADQITRAILDGQLEPGGPLPTERELTEMFGVSRASIREALRSLEAQGLVLAGGRPGSWRASVANPSGPLREAVLSLLRLQRVELGDLVDFRCIVEAAAVKRAAGRKDLEHLSRAAEALDSMSETDSVEDFYKKDVEFHLALAAASGNEMLYLTMVAVQGGIGLHLREALEALADPEVQIQRLITEHSAVLSAVNDGDGNRAADLMRDHIAAFYDSYVRGRV